MMLLGADRKPNRDKIKKFLEEISNSVDMTKKDREYILAMEEKITEQRAKEEKDSLLQRRRVEHKRVQLLLDTEVIKESDLMRQEVKQFKLLRKPQQEKLVPLARCPSPSPVLSTPMFKKRRSIFLTRDFFNNTFIRDITATDVDEEANVDDANELAYANYGLQEMAYATKVDQLYGLAEKLIYVTDEGCKDVAAKLKL